MKIRLVGAELFHADRRDEVSSCFSQFCERSTREASLIEVVLIRVNVTRWRLH